MQGHIDVNYNKSKLIYWKHPFISFFSKNAHSGSVVKIDERNKNKKIIFISIIEIEIEGRLLRNIMFQCKIVGRGI